MLFDEKKMPYHLMLQKFLLSGGQNAFFDAFYWALSIGYSIPPEDGLDADLPEFTGEFLDSWLVLLEKMVNPKAGKSLILLGFCKSFSPILAHFWID